ncbi:hypothetical protein FBZ93_10472 [Bradyrhizobium macuxiense]|uniref:Uncharacterized protein n=1 Tax=Bradyrhizobium macuxiense TaxID=1755647 RepID=A0A560M551_9BRAD|nr:hypothetical protein [Bradyrhizobium macuxiense]TWC00801.1 hypothetical protein FBZ93_10472 [Bradyrhizobium macuxiense]
MSAFEQGRVRPGADGLANTAAEKLRSMVPAAGAMAYPFVLDAFHLAVSPASGQLSPGRLVLAALCLLAATAVPLLGLACAWWLTKAAPSFFELRARRLAYVSIAAPPLFVLTGVGLGLLHIPISDELVWVAAWLAASLYVLLGGEQERPATSAASAPSLAGWRVAHGIAAAVILLYVAFHLTNHLLGLLGPDVHGAVMKIGRTVYRSSVIEPILVGLMLFQVAVGVRLAWRWSALPADAYRVFQIGSGTYLAAFIVTHLNSAFVSARAAHHIDTNWDWASGAPTGLIHDAWSIRLVPHYALGVFFVLGHLAAGLRGVLIAHGIATTIANRIWAIGLAMGGLIAIAIMSGLCGARI